MFKSKKPVASEAELLKEMASLMDQKYPDAKGLLLAGGEPLDEAMLTRFLHAEKNKPEAAAQRLSTYAQWRGNDCHLGSMRRDEVTGELAMNKVFYTDARDRQGHPLLIIKGARHNANTRDVEECKRFAIFCLDTMVMRMDPATNPSGKMCNLVDMSGVGYSNLDSTVLIACFRVLQNFYPERMAAIWFYDAPTIFWSTWKLVTPFLDPVSREKVHFVYSSDKSAQKLFEEFDRAQLPEEYGGTGKLYPADAFYDELRSSKRAMVDPLDSTKAHQVPLPPPEPVPEEQEEGVVTNGDAVNGYAQGLTM